MLNSGDVCKAEKVGIWKGRPLILTYTGKEFPYDDVSPDNICIEDIAHSLAHLCRYTGHTCMFYSVAQHSLLVAEKIPGGPGEKLVGLLHDAAEAYTNDLASPLKRWLGENDCSFYKDTSAYSDLQDEITAAVYRKYGITSIPNSVRLYDQAAGLFEAEGFMGLSVEQLERYPFPLELRGLWQPWDPKGFAGKNVDREFGEVETEFIRRFEALMYAVGREKLI
jgi:hypothetical protein